MLRDCGILVRAHPREAREWRNLNFDGLDNIVRWPPGGDFPIDTSSKTDYFDSLYHASAVIGINSSAMIEAAIVGRPVHTVLLPEFREVQEGTLHFHDLLDGPDALLQTTRSLDEHCRNLASVLGGAEVDRTRSDRFVHAFVRPHGIDTAATHVFVEALEAVAAQAAPTPEPPPLWAAAVRPFLWPFAETVARRERRLRGEARRHKDQVLLEYRRRKATWII